MWGAILGAGASILGSVLGAKKQASSAQQASDAQVAMNQASIAEQKRQFDYVRELLNPYVQSGNSALGQQGDLLGLNGVARQQSAIDSLQSSPFLQSAYKQAENAILQNASATGGLRGGNVQSALADNRMNMLNQAYNNQIQNLGGLVSLGQNAAAGVGNAGASFANNVSELNTGTGQSLAGLALAKGNAQAGIWNAVGGLGAYGLANGLGLLGNRSSGGSNSFFGF